MNEDEEWNEKNNKTYLRKDTKSFNFPEGSVCFGPLCTFSMILNLCRSIAFCSMIIFYRRRRRERTTGVGGCVIVLGFVTAHKAPDSMAPVGSVCLGQRRQSGNNIALNSIGFGYLWRACLDAIQFNSTDDDPDELIGPILPLSQHRQGSKVGCKLLS